MGSSDRIIKEVAAEFGAVSSEALNIEGLAGPAKIHLDAWKRTGVVDFFQRGLCGED